ncbi:MAG: hypothetical protein ACRET3_14530, partial [Burkholderiales bacterium]
MTLMRLAAALALLSTVASAQTPVGVFDHHADVGRVRRPGSALYDPQWQEYMIAGSGQNMWDARDDFHFVADALPLAASIDAALAANAASDARPYVI